MMVNDLYESRKTHPPSCLNARDLPRLLNARDLPRHLAFDLAGKVPCIQNKMADVFSYKSFTFICFHANFSSFSFVDRQNAYSCKSDLFANQKIFQCSLYFSMHSEWRYSLLFTSVSSSRRCWSLDLARVCLFVMSSYTPPFFFFFFSFSFPMIIFPVLG